MTITHAADWSSVTVEMSVEEHANFAITLGAALKTALTETEASRWAIYNFLEAYSKAASKAMAK